MFRIKRNWLLGKNYDYDRNLLVFSIGDKWFCFVNIEVFDFCDLKSAPDVSADLQAEYEAVKPGYHMNHKHWISVYFNQDIPDKRIFELIDDAYQRVLDSLPKREREKYKVSNI
ncbi:MmcQ/YjbR family DNA-binding protein [Prevotella denticola]|uniref:MmcQ/YjbR family DNA-binding protein n=1 Tax=Prevotella denticola TaxID=28129 RepID=UPI0031193846